MSTAFERTTSNGFWVRRTKRISDKLERLEGTMDKRIFECFACGALNPCRLEMIGIAGEPERCALPETEDPPEAKWEEVIMVSDN